MALNILEPLMDTDPILLRGEISVSDSRWYWCVLSSDSSGPLRASGISVDRWLNFFEFQKREGYLWNPVGRIDSKGHF